MIYLDFPTAIAIRCLSRYKGSGKVRCEEKNEPTSCMASLVVDLGGPPHGAGHWLFVLLPTRVRHFAYLIAMQTLGMFLMFAGTAVKFLVKLRLGRIILVSIVA